MKLSEHFTLVELTVTNCGLSNIPNQNAINSLKLLCEKVLEPARIIYGKPIKVNSGYRSLSVNKAIGGVQTSQHLKGEAADIDVGTENHILFDIIKNNFVFDQLIWEKGTKQNPEWIHVSYKSSGNRKQILHLNV